MNGKGPPAGLGPTNLKAEAERVWQATLDGSILTTVLAFLSTPGESAPRVLGIDDRDWIHLSDEIYTLTLMSLRIGGDNRIHRSIGARMLLFRQGAGVHYRVGFTILGACIPSNRDK